MKVLTTTLLGLCLVALTLPAWSQSTNQESVHGKPSHGVLGYLDPRTGTFKPMPPQSTGEAPTPPPTQGTIVINLYVKVASTFPAGEQFSCGGSASVFESSFFDEEASVVGNLSGDLLTCTITIPYYWRLSTPGSDTVSVGFTVQAVGPSSSGGLPQRLSDQSIATIPVPAQYKTTTFSLSATI